MHNVKTALLILTAFALAALLTAVSVLIWPQPRPRTAAHCTDIQTGCLTVKPKDRPLRPTAVKEFAI